jgi:hypothetical protein
VRHSRFVEPSQRLWVWSAEHLLLDTAFGQSRDRVEAKGFGSAGRSAGDHVQDSHCCLSGTPDLRSMAE